MYNFGISSALKAWFDHILRPQVTFRYTENGPEGLLPGKRVIVVETRGGVYGEGPASEMDHQEPHLRSMLGFMGITDVRFVRVEGMAFGPEAAEKAIEGAMSELGRLSGQARALAA
jgi:FMN-dependent NADH-azoreductase